MKLRIEAKPLAEATHWVSRALPVRPPVPVLGGLLLEADTHATVDGLIVSGFDYETSARVELDATVGEPGRVLVSGRLLADIVKSLPDKPVDLTSDGARLSIVCGSSRFSVPLMPVDDYPALPPMPARTGTVAGDVWASAVGQVTMAAGRDDSLPMLTGVRLEVDGERITMAATDRFRLAVREFGWQPDQADVSAAVLLPARTLAEMAKSLSSAGTVDVSLADKGMVGFTAAGRRATTRLLDVEFPRFRQLIPADFTTTAEVEVAELQAALKRVALVTDRLAQVILDITADGIGLSAGGDDTGSAEEAIPATVQGEGLRIAFNPAYMLDALTSLPTARATLGFNHPNKPAIVRPAGEAADNIGLTYLLMPVRIGGNQ